MSVPNKISWSAVCAQLFTAYLRFNSGKEPYGHFHCTRLYTYALICYQVRPDVIYITEPIKVDPY